MTKQPTNLKGTSITPRGVGEATRAALAAVEGRPEGVLATLFANLDEAHAQATARVESLLAHKDAMIAEIDAEIEVARRDLAATTTLINMRDGKALAEPRATGRPAAKKATQSARKPAGSPSNAEVREPRGEVPKAVMALLEKNGDGLTRSDIITKLKLSDEKAGQTAVSNFLAASKKKGRIIHEDDGRYRLNI